MWKKIRKMIKQILKAPCCVLADFTIIRIHKETETKGICKLSESTKLYSTTYLFHIFTH